MKTKKLFFFSLLLIIIITLVGCNDDNDNNEDNSDYNNYSNREYWHDFYGGYTMELPFEITDVVYAEDFRIYFKTELTLQEMINSFNSGTTYRAFLGSSGMQRKIIIRTQDEKSPYFSIYWPNSSLERIFIFESPSITISDVTFFFPIQLIHGENLYPSTENVEIRVVGSFNDLITIYKASRCPIIEISESNKTITIIGHKDLYSEGFNISRKVEMKFIEHNNSNSVTIRII